MSDFHNLHTKVFEIKHTIHQYEVLKYQRQFTEFRNGYQRRKLKDLQTYTNRGPYHLSTLTGKIFSPLRLFH